jgi:hypothetical protein
LEKFHTENNLLRGSWNPGKTADLELADVSSESQINFEMEASNLGNGTGQHTTHQSDENSTEIPDPSHEDVLEQTGYFLNR